MAVDSMEKSRRIRQSSRTSTVGSTSPSEWRTPPLWGVADSAPYLHDGRAATLAEAIKLHAGQAASSANRFAGLSNVQQEELIAFLNTLRAPSVECGGPKW